MSSIDRFDLLVNEAVAQQFSGWDFSFVAGRILEDQPCWDYSQLVANKLPSATHLVDLNTGGGEFLNRFAVLPTHTTATESFAPNVAVAKAQLEPRGVTVVAVTSDERLPLASDQFDLVINRHGAYSVKELQRIAAKSGSTFLTQQVGSQNAIGVNNALNLAATGDRPWNLAVAASTLEAQGFTVVRRQEAYLTMSFKDIGALVFYLKAIPWQAPDFDLDRQRPALVRLHQQIESTGSFDVTAHRFLIEASLG